MTSYTDRCSYTGHKMFLMKHMYKQHECIVVEQHMYQQEYYCWANMYKQQECVVDVVVDTHTCVF